MTSSKPLDIRRAIPFARQHRAGQPRFRICDGHGGSLRMQQVFSPSSATRSSDEASSRMAGSKSPPNLFAKHSRNHRRPTGRASRRKICRAFLIHFYDKELARARVWAWSLCYGFVKEHGGSIPPSSELAKAQRLSLNARDGASDSESRPVETKKLTNGNGKRI